MSSNSIFSFRDDAPEFPHSALSEYLGPNLSKSFSYLPEYSGANTLQDFFSIVQGFKDAEAGKKRDLWALRIDGEEYREENDWTPEYTERWIATQQKMYEKGYDRAKLIFPQFRDQVVKSEDYVRVVKRK